MTTWAEAAALVIDLVARNTVLEGERADWVAGTLTGGNGQGDYPFTQPDGFVMMVPCPAKLYLAHGDPSVIVPQLQALVSQAQVAAAAGRLAALETGYIYRWRTASKRLLGGFLRDGTFAPLKFLAPALSIGRSAIANAAVAVAQLDPSIVGRLLSSAAVSAFLSAVPLEAGGGIRIKIGKRVLATIDIVRGFYPRRLTIPASAKVDDLLSVPITDRLFREPVGSYFARARLEVTEVLRYRVGKRMLLGYQRGKGLLIPLAQLGAGSTIADQPGVPLVKRLGGPFGGAAANAHYVVLSEPDSANAKQLRSYRLSDGAEFMLTSDGENSAPTLTNDDKVIFYSTARAAAMIVPAEGGAAVPVHSSPVITCWGDSLTAGTPAIGSGYPEQLAALMGREVRNYGVPSNYSKDVAARQGGALCGLTLSGNQIVASGSGTISAWTDPFPIMVTLPAPMTGTIAGVRVSIAATTFSGNRPTAATYTRLEPGTVVAVAPGTPFIPDIAVNNREATQIIANGYNDVAFKGGSYAAAVSGIVANDAAMVAYLSPRFPRYLIGGIPAALDSSAGDLAAIADANAQLSAIYGPRFVALGAPPTTAEMAVLGYTPTSNDLADIAAGLIPRGMRADNLHLTTVGYGLWARRIATALTAKGW